MTDWAMALFTMAQSRAELARLRPVLDELIAVRADTVELGAALAGGEPTALGGLPEWKAFDPADPSTMVLGKESGPQPIAITKEAWKLLHEEEREVK